MKKNYYSIHKNKKKRKSIARSQLETLRLLNAINGFVYAIMNLRSSMFGMLIPKYKLGEKVAEGTIKLPDNIPLVFGYEKDSDYEQFKNNTFEM